MVSYFSKQISDIVNVQSFYTWQIKLFMYNIVFNEIFQWINKAFISIQLTIWEMVNSLCCFAQSD